jgi:PAS domain S-box-containing protein
MKSGSAPSHSISSETQHQAKFYAVSQELINLIGQLPKTVLCHLFTSLAHITDASGGHLLLTDAKGASEYCLVLEAGHIDEYAGASSHPLCERELTAWVCRHRQGILITDTTQDPRWSPWSETLEEIQAGSILAAPIQVTDSPIGVVTLVARQPHHFAKADLDLTNHLVHQAAIIAENTRLTANTAQQQTAIDALCQTAHITNSSLDLDQILSTVLEQLKQAIPHQGALLLLREDERLHVAATTGFVVAEKLTYSVFTAADNPAVFAALRRGRTIISNDGEQTIDLGLTTLSEPIGSWVLAPLKARGETLGLVLIANSKTHAYDDQAISTINAFADHLALATANHHLVQETDQRLRELAFLNETGQAITSTLNLDRILQLLLERVRDLLGIDAVSIALRDEQTGELVFEAASGEGASSVLGIRLKPGQGIAGWVAETGKALVVPDAYKDARFFPNIDEQTGMMTQAIVCVPIVLKGHVVGIIEALNPGEVPFDEQATELLSALAGLAATAIDNAQLFAQVRSAEARYEGLFEDSVDPIIITDLQGTIVDANRNACALLGQTKETLLDANLIHFRSAGGNLDFTVPHKQILAGRDVLFQTKMISNGQQIIVEIRGKQVPVRGTTLIQWIGHDISAAVELEQTREDLVRMIVHDLRNPLANIMNSLDVLQEVILEDDDHDAQLELVGIAERSGQRLQQLIGSILDISRLETGQTILETEVADLVPVLNNAIDFVRPQAEIREIELTVDLAASLSKVEMDKEMIMRVVLNLLDNAIKFNKVGGKVKIEAKEQAGKIQVAIIDDGPGIPPDQLQSIFEKFVRVRRKGGPQGTGLGLAFCHLAIKAHGGHIWAESEPGQGTTLCFVLPVN